MEVHGVSRTPDSPCARAEAAAGDPGPGAGQGHSVPSHSGPAGDPPGELSHSAGLSLPTALPPPSNPCSPSLTTNHQTLTSLLSFHPCSGLRAAGRHLPLLPGAYPGRVGPQETPSGSPAGEHPGPGETGPSGAPALSPLRQELTVVSRALPLASPGEAADQSLYRGCSYAPTAAAPAGVCQKDAGEGMGRDTHSIPA